MWYLVKGLCEIHDDHIRLSVTPVQRWIQVTNHVMKELNQLGLARPLTGPNYVVKVSMLTTIMLNLPINLTVFLIFYSQLVAIL